MTTVDVIKPALERNWGMVDAALEGLDEATLVRQPTSQCNSIAWLLWHMTRVVDTIIQVLRGEPQLWVRDGWHRQFGMRDDPGERGRGWTAEQLAAWQAPAKEVQLQYYEAVKSSTRVYLSSLPTADLAQPVVIPPRADPYIGADILGVMVWDNIAHGGQIAYLSGYYRNTLWSR
jgi:uncharacterized damage-inducible protein DinB